MEAAVAFSAPLVAWLAGMLCGAVGARRLSAALYLAASLTVLGLSMYVFSTSSKLVVTTSLALPHPLAAFRFEVDVLTAYFLAALSLSWLVASLVHDYYWRLQARESRLYTLLLGLSMASMYLVCVSRDLLSLMVSWEAMSFSLGLLVAYGEEERARLASLLYLVMMHVLSMPMLVAVAYLLARGVTWYAGIEGLGAAVCSAALASFLVAFTAKSALFPFYAWLPPAHTLAPTDASIVLSGSSVKPSILQALLLLKAVGAPHSVLGLVAVQAFASIAIGVAGALWSREGKRVLAYTTIAYMGASWLLLAVYEWASTPPLLYAMLALVLGHAAYKSLAFTATGLAKTVWGTDELTSLGGLCWRRGFCGVALAAALAMGVFPPFTRFYTDLVALLAVAAALPASREAAGLAAAALISSAVLVGLSYIRLIAALHNKLAPPREPGEPSRVLVSGLWGTGALSSVMLAVWAWRWGLLGLTPLAVFTAIVAVSTLLGLAEWRRTSKAPAWFSGEEAVYVRGGVVSSAAPISIKAPPRSIEGVVARLRKPGVREVSYERVYTLLAHAFRRAVLEPLVIPVRTGSLALYTSIMLAYFALILLVAWWSPW